MTEARLVDWEKPYYTKVDCVRQQTNAIATQDLTDEQIELYIFQVQSIVDSELVNFYSVPFAREDVPPVISTVSCLMAASLILRKLYTGEANNISEHEEPLWTQAMDILEKLKSGDMLLVRKNGQVIYPSMKGFKYEEEYSDVMPDFGQEYPDRVI